MMKNISVTLVLLIVLLLLSCNKNEDLDSLRATDRAAFEQMEEARAMAVLYNDSLVYLYDNSTSGDFPGEQAYRCDSLYHHYRYEWDHHHGSYHHDRGYTDHGHHGGMMDHHGGGHRHHHYGDSHHAYHHDMMEDLDERHLDYHPH